MAKTLPTSNEPKRKRVQITFTLPSKTKQEYADQTDINKIIARFKATGELPIIGEPVYADVSNFPDYREIVHQAETARNAFLQLPADIRAKFNNDPGLLLEWASDPRNQAEAVQLGILKAPDQQKQEVKQEPETKSTEGLTKPPEI